MAVREHPEWGSLFCKDAPRLWQNMKRHIPGSLDPSIVEVYEEVGVYTHPDGTVFRKKRSRGSFNATTIAKSHTPGSGS